VMSEGEVGLGGLGVDFSECWHCFSGMDGIWTGECTDSQVCGFGVVDVG
jgi:hypothetical protein